MPLYEFESLKLVLSILCVFAYGSIGRFIAYKIHWPPARKTFSGSWLIYTIAGATPWMGTAMLFKELPVVFFGGVITAATLAFWITGPSYFVTRFIIERKLRKLRAR